MGLLDMIIVWINQWPRATCSSRGQRTLFVDALGVLLSFNRGGVGILILQYTHSDFIILPDPRVIPARKPVGFQTMLLTVADVNSIELPDR